MNNQIKGTISELMSVVSTKTLSAMVSQKRKKDYVFTIDTQNGITLIW